MTGQTDEWRRRKAEIRRQALALRDAHPDKDAASRAICARLGALPEYAAARTLLLYVHARSEVRTREFVARAMTGGRRVAVPFCAGGELRLFHLEDVDELAEGTFGIPEPSKDLRTRPGKRVDLGEVDLVVVPGVAFDRQGGRIGHGKGYYDRLLARARPDATVAAVAYECQLFPEVPMLASDVFMDKVVTEKAVYQGRGRAASQLPGTTVPE